MNFDPAAAEPPAPESRRATLLATLPTIEDDLAALQAAQASFAYLGKWQAQLREALLTLM